MKKKTIINIKQKKMNNAMMQLNLYKREKTWMFDDSSRSIKAEPFVLGMSEMISHYVNDDKAKKTTITFSKSKFPGCNKLDLLYEDSNGGWYIDPKTQMKGWLCPVTRMYLDTVPKHIYFSVEKYKRKPFSLKSLLFKLNPFK